MTYAPPTLAVLGAYLSANGVENLGIVGDTSHTYGYHLGRDRIYGPGGKGDADYSVQLDRDKAGLTDAAAGIDLGGDAATLRALTRWLWDQCLAHEADTADIREVIGSADGTNVFGWSSKAPNQLILNYGDATHLWHTHISYFRDTETRDKRPLFFRFFAIPPDTSTGDDAMPGPNVTALGAWAGTATIGASVSAIRADGAFVPLAEGSTYSGILVGEIDYMGVTGQVVGINPDNTLHYVLTREATLVADVGDDCTEAIRNAVVAEYNRVTQGAKISQTIIFPDPPK